MIKSSSKDPFKVCSFLGTANVNSSNAGDIEQNEQDTQDYTQQEQDQYQEQEYDFDYNYDEYGNYQDTTNTGEYYEDPNDIVDHSYDDIAEQESYNQDSYSENTGYDEYNSYYEESADDPSILQQQVTYSLVY